MGIGAKIKDALSGDKSTSHQDTAATRTSHTPGAYPSETSGHGDALQDTTHNTSTLDPRSENLHGTTASDGSYSYGQSGTTGVGHDSSHLGGSRHDEGLTGTTGTASLTGAHGTHGTHGEHGTHNKLTKSNNKQPYWGETERAGTHGHGTTTGAYEGAGTGVGTPSHAQEVNDRYNSTSGTTAHTGPMSHNSRTGGDDAMYGGTTGAAIGSTGREGLSHTGPGAHHTHDKSHSPSSGLTGTTGHTGHSSHTGPSSGNDLLYGGITGEKTGVTGREGLTTTGPGAHHTNDKAYTPTSGATGAASNLTHRPHDNSNTLGRDHKTDEYDAPSNSSGRGHTGALAGAGVSAAGAGAAASELSNRHHEHDMREYNTPGSGSDAYGAGSTGRTGEGLGAAHGAHQSSTTGTGSSMLDPYNQQSGTTTGALGSSSHGDHHNTHDKQSGGGIKGAIAGLTSGSHGHHQSTHDQQSTQTTGRDSGYGQGHEGVGGASGLGASSLGQGSHSTTGAGVGSTTSGSGMGQDHYGPGHSGAKVMHKCHSCGEDNDISKYFGKEATYRMG